MTVSWYQSLIKVLLSRFPQSCRHFHNAETGTQYLVSPSPSPTCSLSPLSRAPACCGFLQCEPGYQNNVGTVIMLLSTLLLVQYEVCALVVQQCLFVCSQAGRTLFTPRASRRVYPHGLAVSPVSQADLHLHSSIMPLVLQVSTSLGGCCLNPCPGVCAVSFAMCAVALLTGCAQPEVHRLLRSCVSRFPFRKDGKNLET